MRSISRKAGSQLHQKGRSMAANKEAFPYPAAMPEQKPMRGP